MTKTETKIQNRANALAWAAERLRQWADFEYQAKRRGRIDPERQVEAEATRIIEMAGEIRHLMTLRETEKTAHLTVKFKEEDER